MLLSLPGNCYNFVRRMMCGRYRTVALVVVVFSLKKKLSAAAGNS